MTVGPDLTANGARDAFVAKISTPVSQGPTNKDQCKNGGWQTFTNPTFSNQGDCVSYVNHLNH